MPPKKTKSVVTAPPIDAAAQAAAAESKAQSASLADKYKQLQQLTVSAN